MADGASDGNVDGDDATRLVVAGSMALLVGTAAAVEEEATGEEAGPAGAVEVEDGLVGVSPILTQPDLAVIAVGQLTSDHSTLRVILVKY